MPVSYGFQNVLGENESMMIIGDELREGSIYRKMNMIFLAIFLRSNWQ